MNQCMSQRKTNMEICSNLPENEQRIDDLPDDGWTQEAVDELEEKISQGEE